MLDNGKCKKQNMCLFILQVNFLLIGLWNNQRSKNKQEETAIAHMAGTNTF